MHETITIHNKAINKKKLFFFFCLLILFIFGGILRYKGLLSRELEYDEAWTYSNYANKSIISIFSDLSTPNNHPLYSLMIKAAIPLLQNPVLAIRLPAFLAGLALIIVLPSITFLLTRNSLATLLSSAIIAFNGAFIHFSQTGRGYTLQSLFIALFILQIIVTLRIRNRYTKAVTYTLFLFPILSILTLSTSVLYIFPICLVHIIYTITRMQINKNEHNINIKQFIRTHIPLLTAYLILTAFTLFWYISNYNAFIAGQSFGTPISSLQELFHFTETTLLKLTSSIFLLILLFPIVNNKNYRISAMFLVCFLFPFLMSVLFLAGPPRVYIPTLILVAIALPVSITRPPLTSTKYKVLTNSLFIAIIFLCFAQYFQEYNRWTALPWGAISKNLYQRYPDNYFIVYPPSTSYVVFLNDIESPEKNAERLPKGKKHYLMLIGNNILQGMGRNNKQVSFSINKQPYYSSMDIPTQQQCSIYQLEALSDLPPNSNLHSSDILFVSIYPTNSADFMSVRKMISDAVNSEWLICNFFLNGQRKSQNSTLYGGLVAHQLKESVKVKNLLKLEDTLKPFAAFYIIQPNR